MANSDSIPAWYERLARRGQVASFTPQHRDSEQIEYLDSLAPLIRHETTRPQDEMLEELCIKVNEDADQ